MVVYKLYKHDQKEEPHLVGILPERRKKQERISEESVLNWGKEVIGETSDFNDIYCSNRDVGRDQNPQSLHLREVRPRKEAVGAFMNFLTESL